MIELVGVVKRYKAKSPGKGFIDAFFPKEYWFTAVDTVSLSIKKNEFFGLLGPNGAGKTTILSLLAGLIFPTSGRIHLGSKKIGVMLGDKMIYHRITGYDNLEYFAEIYKVKDKRKRILELAALFKMRPFLHEYVERYSLGMRVKLALARALIHDPDILLLDEPTLGLDVGIAQEVRMHIKSLRKTVILTTHYLEEADMLCDRVAILNKGRVVAVDTPHSLKARAGTPSLELTATKEDSLEKELLSRKIPFSREDGHFKIFYQGESDLQYLLNFLAKHKILTLITRSPSLGDAFLMLTGEELG